MYVSPAEPTFWLHHGQLDRHWWMWANYREADLKTRTSQYEGRIHHSPITMRILIHRAGGTNWQNPNSARGKPTDAQWLDVTAPSGKNGIPSNQLFSTTAGPFCYLYQ